jgi:hypothetical protein
MGAKGGPNGGAMVRKNIPYTDTKQLNMVGRSVVVVNEESKYRLTS